MDTIEQNTAPVGAEGATSSPDTAAQVDTQPVETEAGVSDAKTEETGEASETLYAGKYKSVEDLEKAYQEIQQSVGKASQKAELVNLLEQETGMSADQIKHSLAQRREQQFREQVEANPGLAAYQEVQTLKGQIALQAEEKELDGFLQKNPEYAPFREKIFKLGLNIEKDKSYDEIAKEYFGESRAQGQQDAYKKIEMKKNTQSSGSVSTPQKKFSIEDMKGMTAAEMRAILPHAQ